MNGLTILGNLYRYFPDVDSPADRFSRFERSIGKQLGLVKASLLFLQKEGFKSLNSQSHFEISRKSPVFQRLLRHTKPLMSSKAGKDGWMGIWPVMIGKECAACYVLGPKANGTALTDEEKIILGFLTERTATFLVQRKMWNDLENLNRQSALEWISAAVIHEIRNPLTALNTLVELLPRKKNDDDFMISFQRLMTKEIQRLIHLTSKLLSFSKNAAQPMTSIDLREILQETIQLLKPIFDSRKVRIKLETSRPLRLNGNEDQVKGVMINLIQNALKATSPHGQVDIQAHLWGRKGSKSRWIMFQVKNDGRGIEKKDIPRIFNPFYSTHADGTGLGLAICKKVVENHKGYIKVKSNPEKGTSFSVFFPAE